MVFTRHSTVLQTWRGHETLPDSNFIPIVGTEVAVRSFGVWKMKKNAKEFQDTNNSWSSSVIPVIITQVAQAMGNVILRNVWDILNCPQNVLNCNKIVHSAQLTCVVVISCVFRVFGGDLAVIWGVARTKLIPVFVYKSEIIFSRCASNHG